MQRQSEGILNYFLEFANYGHKERRENGSGRQHGLSYGSSQRHFHLKKWKSAHVSEKRRRSEWKLVEYFMMPKGKEIFLFSSSFNPNEDSPNGSLMKKAKVKGQGKTKIGNWEGTTDVRSSRMAVSLFNYCHRSTSLIGYTGHLSDSFPPAFFNFPPREREGGRVEGETGEKKKSNTIKIGIVTFSLSSVDFLELSPLPTKLPQTTERRKRRIPENRKSVHFPPDRSKFSIIGERERQESPVEETINHTPRNKSILNEFILILDVNA